MVAEIIGVGTELLLGDIVNTNAQFLSQELAALGISVHFQSTVGDNRDRLIQVMSQALERSDIVITTGGLGPTTDDITKETICEGLNIPLVVNEESLRRIREFFARTGRVMPEANIKQAMVPQGATVFQNDHGTAPGCAVSAGKQCIVMLPGPPSELQPMFHDSVSEYLSRFSSASIVSRNIKVMGMGESAVEEALGDFVTSQNPTVATYAKEGEVLVRVTARGQNKEDAASLAAPVVQAVCDRLGSYVYGIDVDNLQQAVVHLLQKKNLKVATAESCTGGLLSQRITEVPGSSRVFEFGVSAYANRVKVQKLGVPERMIKKYGAISEQVAAAMAAGALKQGKANIGVGITGNAGPNADEDKPVGLVYVAVCDATNVWIKKLVIGRGKDDREYVRNVAVLQALNMVRLYIDYYPDVLPGAIPLATALKGKLENKDDNGKLHTKNNGVASEGSGADANLPWYRRLLMRLWPQKGDSRQDILRKVVLLGCIVVFLGSAGYIGKYYYDSFSNKSLMSGLSDLFHMNEDDIEVPSDYPAGYLKKFASLYTRNPDIQGYIEIKDTPLSQPIVQAEDNDFYLRRDFDKKDNQWGVFFFDYRVFTDVPSRNMLVFGHNMKDGTMFGELENYKKLDYYRTHPIINFDTVHREGEYKVIAMFITNAYAKDGPVFDYVNFIEGSDEEFMDFISEVKVRSLLITTVDVKPTDTIITLSTCDYAFKDSRMVVVARRVRDGESSKVDVANARLNPSPVMPQAYYAELSRQMAEQLKKQAEEEAKNSNRVELAKWLTSDEMAILSPEEQQQLMEQRKREADIYLSGDEKEVLTAQEKIDYIESRKVLFAKWLTDDELYSLSFKQKQTTISQRQALAHSLLTPAEIEACRTWAELSALIAQRQAAAQQIAVVTASPGAGTYPGAQNVSLSCATAGAVIYYTTDGSAPTDQSAQYGGPIAVNASMTIKAFSQLNTAKSAVQTFKYIINATKTLSNVTIDALPSKTAYTVGEGFDLSGLVVTAHYTDNTTANVTSACTVTPAQDTVINAGSSPRNVNISVTYTEGGVPKSAARVLVITVATAPSSSSTSSSTDPSGPPASSSEAPSEPPVSSDPTPPPPPEGTPVTPPTVQMAATKETLTVYDTGSGKTVTDTSYNIVSKVVQNETSGAFHTEALKAQAVATYTNIKFENSQNRNPSVRLSSSPNSKVQAAVSAVLGQAVYYKNNLCFTTYFATSAGSTNSSQEVWGGSYPYLTSVDSSIDANAPNYEVTTRLSSASVKASVKSALGITLSGDPNDWFEVLNYTSGGYNDKMSVGGYTRSPKDNKVITGRLIRESVLSLRSACFDFYYDDAKDQFVFTTYGYGHGVGMSQNGANLYASQKGWNYAKILTYYYPGTTVQ